MRPAGVLCFILMSLLGLVDISEAQNCSRPIPGPNMHLTPEDIGKTVFEDKSVTTFVCETGYMVAGGLSSITCTRGVWSAVTLNCTRKNCGNPGPLLNGEIHIIDGTLFGDKVLITCNTGYNMVPAGQNERICGNGIWTTRLPVCEVAKCLPPPEVVNARPPNPVRDSYDYGQVLVYKCLNDYTLNGSSSITCSENKKFKPDPPTCIKVLCLPPNIPNAIRASGALPPYGYKDFVSYECKSGFTMQGSSGLECQLDSTWSPELPVCTILTTKPPTTTSTTHSTKKIPGPGFPNDPTTPTIENSGPQNHKWWQSWWFIILVLIVAAILVCLLIKYLKERRRKERSFPVDGPL